MSLERLNATLFAKDEAIDLGEVKATRDTQYRLQSQQRHERRRLRSDAFLA